MKSRDIHEPMHEGVFFHVRLSEGSGIRSAVTSHCQGRLRWRRTVATISACVASAAARYALVGASDALAWVMPFSSNAGGAPQPTREQDHRMSRRIALSGGMFTWLGAADMALAGESVNPREKAEQAEFERAMAAEDEKDCECCKTDWCGCQYCTDCYAYLKSKGYSLPMDARGAYAKAGENWASELNWESAFQSLPQATATAGIKSLDVRLSALQGAGQGLFAKEDLAKGAVLPPYQGRVLGFAEGQAGGDYVWCPVSAGLKFVFEEEATTKGALAKEPSYCIDSSKATTGNPARYVNAAARREQCKQVNLEICEIGDVMYFRTTGPISAGTEFIADYGDFYWSNNETC